MDDSVPCSARNIETAARGLFLLGGLLARKLGFDARLRRLVAMARARVGIGLRHRRRIAGRKGIFQLLGQVSLLFRLGLGGRLRIVGALLILRS